MTDVKTVDLKGLNCPMPVLKTKKALEGLAQGEVVAVEITDPGSKTDIPAMLKRTGNQLVEVKESAGVFTFVIKKRGSVTPPISEKETTMKRLTLILAFVLLLSGVSYATNGDNLIGVGPISRSMGGVGVASPQDPISAVFANPAAMCFGPYCPGSEQNFAGTVFVPTVRARVKMPFAEYNVKSQSAPFIIPAIGISSPLNLKTRFGLAAYGVSGMGVDYRGLGIDLNPVVAGNEGDIYTQYQVMKFAPNLAYLLTDDLSVGASIHVDYAALDLGSGTSHNYGMGYQLGTIYKTGPAKLGLSYVSPQKVTHERVSDFNHDGAKDALTLEMPQTVAGGVAVEPIKGALIEADVKWINWGDAAGYEDFDWKDQWVYALGLQYKPVKDLALRAGYNYAKSPVKTHNGFNQAGTTYVQGKPVNTFEYEYLRVIGFPAVAEKHLGFGIGYQFSKKFSANIGYKHAFEKTIAETDSSGGITLESKLKEDSYEFGLSWAF